MKIGIIMGSNSDYKIMRQVEEFFNGFGVDYETAVVSAHRTPKMMYEYAQSARERGISIIIAGAGGAAHLPGMVASLSCVPVIGVPIQLKTLDGMDSLLSIVQMPKGVPVATVGINQAENAAILAIEMLAITNQEFYEKLLMYKEELVAKVAAMELV